MTDNQTSDEAPADAGPEALLHSNDPRLSWTAQTLADARNLHSRGLALEDAYIRYLTLANAGGVVGCLGIADALANKSAVATALSSVVGPIAAFFFGVVFCGLVVSLRGKQALHQAEEHARRANGILADIGHGVVLPRGAFGPLEAKALPHLNRMINALGLLGQLAFLVGGIWGLIAMRNLH
jgi:hypothetical protein